MGADDRMRMAGRLGVSRGDGMVMLWQGDPADPAGVILDEAAAVDAARDILALTAPIEGDAWRGALLRIAITPPAGPGASGRLWLDTTEGRFDLALDWSNLVGIATMAQAALNAAPPDGRS